MSAIGVFDSGVGGLTLLRALKERWPGEDFIYLADTARLPYGSKSLHTISHYVEQNIGYLRQYDLKAVVVACNSASTALLERPMKSDVPIFNVVEPGARKAVEVSTSLRIGILGTRATIHSGAYPRAIHKLKADAEVFSQACPLFVPLVEEGWVDDPITNLIVFRYVNEVSQKHVDTLIMGCTHYPVLRQTIQKAAGGKIQLIDSSEGLIEDLAPILGADPSSTAAAGEGALKILCTDYSPRLEETIRFILGPTHVDSLEVVDL